MHAFQTPRLDLRPIAEGDEVLYCQLYTDPDVMRHIAAPLSMEAAQRAFAAVLRQVGQVDSPLRLWVLSDRQPRQDIGILALIRHRDTVDALELGAMLLPGSQGQGLAAEAQMVLLDRVFAQFDTGLVWSRNAAANHAAAGVRRKLGFMRAPAGEGSDEMRWQMTRERWQALRSIPAGMAETAVDR